MSLSDLQTLNGQPARACPKPEKRVRATPRRIRTKSKPKGERDRIAEVRQYVFARERNVCRIDRFRVATEMHELRPRSLRGKVSRTNSVALCGYCHHLIQAHRIGYVASDTLGAEATLYFTPSDEAARDWLRLGNQHGIESAPMYVYEEAE